MSDIEKRRNVYYSNFTFKGERIRRTLATSDPEEAQKRCDQLRAELWEEAKKPQRYTFTDAVALWLETGDKSLSDKYSINAFGIGNVALQDLNEAFLRTILTRNKGATRNRKIALLHAILNCALKRKWITEIPFMQKVEVNAGRIRWLTYDEWNRLDAQLNGHMKPMARFAIYSGLRENNVIELQWRDIDLQRRVAWVHPDRAKGKKPIGIPLSDDAIAVLKGQIGEHDQYVFVYKKKKVDRTEDPPVVTYTSNPVTKTSTKAWKKALVRAGIDVVETDEVDHKGNPILTSTFRWHDLRHTWASWHVMNGTPIEVLQKLGGWEKLEMVLKYAHLAPEHLAGYANNFVTRNLPHADVEQAPETVTSCTA